MNYKYLAIDEKEKKYLEDLIKHDLPILTDIFNKLKRSENLIKSVVPQKNMGKYIKTIENHKNKLQELEKISR